MLLAKILINASLYSPVLIKVRVSNVKDENVVNPPNNPVKRNARVLGEKLNASARLQQKPIRKEPITFTERKGVKHRLLYPRGNSIA